MDYQALKTLIDSEELNAGKTDSQVVTWCNATTDGENPTVSSAEIVTIILGNRTEWEELAPDDKAFLMDIMLIGSGTLIIPAKGGGARNELINIFGDGAMRAEFRQVIKKTSTRAAVAGVGSYVHLGDVQNARAL